MEQLVIKGSQYNICKTVPETSGCPSYNDLIKMQENNRVIICSYETSHFEKGMERRYEVVHDKETIDTLRFCDDEGSYLNMHWFVAEKAENQLDDCVKTSENRARPPRLSVRPPETSWAPGREVPSPSSGSAFVKIC